MMLRHATRALAALAAVAILVSSGPSAQAVIGGHDADNDEATYLVGLHRMNAWVIALAEGKDPVWATQFCGGTLVAPTKVVTAAHCVVHADGTVTDPRDLGVGHGAVDLDDESDYALVETASIDVHPNYSPGTYLDDIAVITLATPVHRDEYVRVALPTMRHLETPGRAMTVTGWGVRTQAWRNPSDRPDLPVRAQTGLVEVVDASLCGGSTQVGVDYHGHLLMTLQAPELNVKPGRSTICAIGYSSAIDDLVDSCQGDSGGPLIDAQTRRLVGVVSWGAACAGSWPGAYTRVRSYFDFLQNADAVLPETVTSA